MAFSLRAPQGDERTPGYGCPQEQARCPAGHTRMAVEPDYVSGRLLSKLRRAAPRAAGGWGRAMACPPVARRGEPNTSSAGSQGYGDRESRRPRALALHAALEL